MSHFALELNDAGLVLARAGGDTGEFVSEHPGVALPGPAGVLTGEAAARQSRLQPLGVQNDFWRNLGTEALPRVAAGRVLSAADLAFEQLTQIIEPVRADMTGLLLAVPPGYSRTQLGLLLGIVNETRVPVLGLADSALLASALEPVGPRVLHLDLQLHQAVLSVLETDSAGFRRSRFEILPRHGWLAFQQAWLYLIAGTFVRRTRFDPLLQAATEQQLVDRLPGWLASLADQESVTAEIEFGQAVYSIELAREEWVAAVQAQYDEILRLVQGARPAGVTVDLQLAHRLNHLPGLGERFNALRDCRVRVLPRGAAALGALSHAGSIRQAADGITLVYRLPLAAAAAEPTPAASEATATPPQLRPTHLLFRGRAWPITDRPLTLGWSVDAGRSVSVPSSPGVSRSHCSVRRQNGSVLLEDHSTYGSFVNDERVNGRAVLTVGDRLRLGSPGVTLDLIQLVNDDGTPQD